MEPVFFVMAILGCGDGSAQCMQARLEPARYETLQQCRAALPEALARNTDLSFPTIAADCRATGAQYAKAKDGAKRG